MLIEQGALQENSEGCISGGSDVDYSMSQDAFKSLLNNSICSFYKPGKLGIEENYLSFQTSEVDRKKQCPRLEKFWLMLLKK